MMTAEQAESEIERRFIAVAEPVLRAGVKLEPQVEFYTSGGNFRGDFIARASGRVVLIECDGRKFHEYQRDRRRDLYILNDTDVTDILHIRGCDLFFNDQGVLDRLQSTFRFLFDPAATPATDDAGALLMLAAMYLGGPVKPIVRLKIPREQYEAGKALLNAHDAVTVLGRTRDASVAVQIKTPCWSWQYDGPHIWQMSDYMEVFGDIL